MITDNSQYFASSIIPVMSALSAIVLPMTANRDFNYLSSKISPTCTKPLPYSTYTLFLNHSLPVNPPPYTLYCKRFSPLTHTQHPVPKLFPSFTSPGPCSKVISLLSHPSGPFPKLLPSCHIPQDPVPKLFSSCHIPQDPVPKLFPPSTSPP